MAIARLVLFSRLRPFIGRDADGIALERFAPDVAVAASLRAVGAAARLTVVCSVGILALCKVALLRRDAFGVAIERVVPDIAGLARGASARLHGGRAFCEMPVAVQAWHACIGATLGPTDRRKTLWRLACEG